MAEGAPSPPHAGDPPRAMMRCGIPAWVVGDGEMKEGRAGRGMQLCPGAVRHVLNRGPVPARALLCSIS